MQSDTAGGILYATACLSEEQITRTPDPRPPQSGEVWGQVDQPDAVGRIETLPAVPRIQFESIEAFCTVG